MAITKPTRPTLIASGVAVVITPRQRFDNDSRKYTDEVVGHEVVLSQADGSQIAVKFPLADANSKPISLPALLTPVHVIATLSESREYGASLTYLRPLSGDDLDRIHSDLSVGAGK